MAIAEHRTGAFEFVATTLSAFEQRMTRAAAMQQCYRTTPGPDVMLVVNGPNMPAYLAVSHQLFTADGRVRNVKVFFSVKSAKFEPK